MICTKYAPTSISIIITPKTESNIYSRYFHYLKTYARNALRKPPNNKLFFQEDIDPEELEMQKRQQMYHRLQWLHSEGERLNAENKMLQQRLAELKRKQKEGLREVGEAMQQAEDRKRHLEQQEVQMGKQ